MKRIIIILFAFLIFFKLAPAQQLLIQKATKLPEIDGVIDSKDPWLPDNWNNLEIGKSAIIGDISAMFQLLYDEN